jgi:hypothetical protein
VPLRFLSTDRFDRLHGGAVYVLVRLPSPSHPFNPAAPVSCLQAWYYFTHHSDPWPIRLLVRLTCCQTLYRILIPFHRSAPSCYLTQRTKYSSRTLVSLCHLPQIPLIMGVAVYIYTISNWGNPEVLGRLVWYACPVWRSRSHIDLTVWNYRSILVEVLFNVGIISISTDRPLMVGFLGTGIYRVPRSKVNLYYGAFDSSPSDSLRSFLAMRIWRCMFRTPTLVHVI